MEHIVSRIGIRMIRRETQVQLTEDVTGNAVSIVGQGWVNGRPTCKDQKVCKDTRTTILSQKATQWYKLYSHVTNRYVDIRTIKQRCTLRSIQSLRKLVQVFEMFVRCCLIWTKKIWQQQNQFSFSFSEGTNSNIFVFFIYIIKTYLVWLFL